MTFDPIFQQTPEPKPKQVKIKIEFSDESGAKYALNIDGMSKDNMSKVMDFVQMMSSQNTQTQDQTHIDTNFSRLYELITKNFRFGSFTSTDVLEAYQDNFPTPTSLSVISTYLTRLANRGLLLRARHGAGWIYKLPRVEQLSLQPDNIRHQEDQNQINTV
ncbi:MAG: hypothetical protein M1368_08100 [Thaumarchaeota archaeon]|nr:hypothetical protein [Nitrososphaerota archaeon]MDG6904815.1 hypothetical protein [Nitrososphaerota archaeon]